MPILSSLRSVLNQDNERRVLEPEHLAGFRKSQELAYEAAQAVERQLKEGMTERDAAALLGDYLRQKGVREYFHQPFAWFGDRTAFAQFRVPLQFFPTSRKLTVGMPVILDVAPIVDGHVADIGYACKLGENALHDRMFLDLKPYRQLILDGVRARRNLSDIYRDVDKLIAQQGYHNRHQAYPFRVLAHRVNYVPSDARTELKLFGFGVPGVSYLFGRLAETVRGAEHHSPLWNDSSASNHPAQPGLWAVEPHIGLNGVGVKWEELLVVTDDDAFWLQERPPHVQRFDELESKRAA